MFRRRYITPSLLFFVVALFDAVALAADVPAKPFSRIEAEQHNALIVRIGVDAAGRRLVTASHDNTARVWNLAGGDLDMVLHPPMGDGDEDTLYTAALSPDGKTVAVGGWTKAGTGADNIYLLETGTGGLLHRIAGLPNAILHLAFSMDGTRLAAALGSGEGIRFYRTDTWAEIGRDQDYGADSYWVSFDVHGRSASSCFDGFIRLYDADQALIGKNKPPGGERPFGLAFSPDGGHIAVGFHDSTAINVLSADDLSLLYAPDTTDIGNGNLASVAWSRDGATLLAAGRYKEFRGHPLVSWPELGKGPARKRSIATDTITDLVPLADGRLAFGAADPAWGVLDAEGMRIVGRGPAIADFRRQGHTLRLSRDGRVAELDFKVLDANLRWREYVLRLDIAERRLTLDPGAETERLQRRLRELGYKPGKVDGRLGPRTHASLEDLQRERGLAVTGEADASTRRALGLLSLEPPRIAAPGLSVTDWEQSEPGLDGKSLNLERFETSWRLDISEDAERVLLGTSRYLRLYDRGGELIWKTRAPATTWMVNLSGDGRWAAAAFGDGSLRWFDAENGEERLGFFFNGVAITELDDREGALPAGEVSTIPWVLWTPGGFFDAAVGGGRFLGWHLSRGEDQVGELINAEQLGAVFRRPDLVSRALDPEYPALAQAAVEEIGSLELLLAGTRAPLLKRLGPAQVRAAESGFEARFRAEDRGSGVGHIEYRINGVLVTQGDLPDNAGAGLADQSDGIKPFTLDPGIHRIEARAFDTGGRLASPWEVWDVEVSEDRRRRAP